MLPKFEVTNKSSPEEAFYFIGQPNPDIKTIIVEDKLSQYIIDEILKSQGDAISSLFETRYFPGGESIIKKEHILVYSRENVINKFIIFDGDQKLVSSPFDPSEVLEKDKTKEFLLNKIKEQTKCGKIEFCPDGNSTTGSNEWQLILLMEKYLTFYKDYVRYLPRKTPEEIIWDDDFCKQLISSDRKDIFKNIDTTPDFKNKFARLAEEVSGDKSDTFTLYKMFFKRWASKENNDYKSILSIINELKDRHD